jgi:hypothetical protein
MITTPPEEPVAAPWEIRSLDEVAAGLLDAIGSPDGRTAVLAVDGRSGSGKSTVAARLAEHIPGTSVVATDDVAWWESFFGWDHLMAAGVLEPARRGEPVCFRPPAWDARGRDGAIEAPAGSRVLIVEGVGAGRRSLRHLLDAVIWVQSDLATARRRGIARDGGDNAAIAFWDEWDAEELPFLAADRPWERARLIVLGTPETVAHDPIREIVVGRIPLA